MCASGKPIVLLFKKTIHNLNYKTFLILVSFTFTMDIVGQNVELTVVSDTIYSNNQFIGYIKNNKLAIVGSTLDQSIVERKLGFDRSYVIADLVLNFDKDNGIIKNYRGQEVGEFSIIKKKFLPAELQINMFTGDYSEETIKEYFFNSKMYFLTSSIIITYNDRDYETQQRIESARKKLEQKQKIERFYAQVFESLKGDIDPIEGIYRSINRGEQHEYDIAILKSTENSREYASFILSTTDETLDVGSVVFTFLKTAQNNLFFVEYILKSGQFLEYVKNKTAVMNGALLEMGVKSFIKMYPGEGDVGEYQEINPLFNWQSSGSGVLVNNSGYIVTNNHVIENAKRIRIAFQNDSLEYSAIILSRDAQADVAILKIEDDRFKSNVNPIKWQTDFKLGEKVFTLGYPISTKMSDNVKVVDGIISGMKGREGNPLYFQTTLPVWYGNSGGPCFNNKGEIIGLATQILFDQGLKVDNVAYVTKTENILGLAGDIIQFSNDWDSTNFSLEDLIEELIPYSVFIKVNY